MTLNNKNPNLFDTSKLLVVHFDSRSRADEIKLSRKLQYFEVIFFIIWKMRLYFSVDVNRHGKINFNEPLFPMLFEEVLNLTFISISMKSKVIHNEISQTKI